MGRYFNVDLVPDMIDGNVATVIQSNGTDLGFNANDILFDWQEIDVPSGSKALTSILMYAMGEDGGAAAAGSTHIIFAKSINGVAPKSLGVVNNTVTGGFDLGRHFVGACGIGPSGGTASDLGYGSVLGLTIGTIFTSGGIYTPDSNANANDGQSWAGVLPQVIDTEPGSGTNIGYDKLYVAAITQNRFDFSTGVLADAVASGNDISVDGVDPAKCFQIGDTIYKHDSNTPLGTVKSMTDDGDNTYHIILNADTAVAVANNDEIVNANAVRLKLGFER